MLNIRCRYLAILLCLSAGMAPAAHAKPTDAELAGGTFAKELAEKTKALCAEYPDVKGSVKIILTVQKNGTVSLAEARDLRLSDTEPVSGILEIVYKWKFTPLETGRQETRITHLVPFSSHFDSTRIFFVAMGAIIATISVLIVLVWAG